MRRRGPESIFRARSSSAASVELVDLAAKPGSSTHHAVYRALERLDPREREGSVEHRASFVRYGLAAAAVLVLALGVWWAFGRSDGSRGPAGASVGTAVPLEILEPKDHVTSFDAIRWRTTTRNVDVRYRVRVVDAHTKGELLVRADVAGTELSLQAVATDAWYDIEITLEEHGGDGALLHVARASARR